MTPLIFASSAESELGSGIFGLTISIIVLLCIVYAASCAGKCVALLREIKELLERRNSSSPTFRR